MKSWNSRTNNKSPGNDGRTEEYQKQFSNELAPVHLVVYNSFGNILRVDFIFSVLHKFGYGDKFKHD